MAETMNLSVTAVPPPRRCVLERHFLTLAIMATSICAFTIIADAAVRDDVANIDFGRTAGSGLFDDQPAPPAAAPWRDRMRTEAPAPSCACACAAANRGRREVDML